MTLLDTSSFSKKYSPINLSRFPWIRFPERMSTRNMQREGKLPMATLSMRLLRTSNHEKDGDETYWRPDKSSSPHRTHTNLVKLSKGSNMDCSSRIIFCCRHSVRTCDHHVDSTLDSYERASETFALSDVCNTNSRM